MRRSARRSQVKELNNLIYSATALALRVIFVRHKRPQIYASGMTISGERTEQHVVIAAVLLHNAAYSQHSQTQSRHNTRKHLSTRQPQPLNLCIMIKLNKIKLINYQTTSEYIHLASLSLTRCLCVPVNWPTSPAYLFTLAHYTTPWPNHWPTTNQ